LTNGPRSSSLLVVKIVAENSAEDLARRSAAEGVGWALRDLAANLIRVVRGAGKSYELGKQAAAFIHALQDYREGVGHYPAPHELNAMVALEDDDTREWSEEERSRRHAERTIIRGALQIAASDMLEQRTQRAAGESELYTGVNRTIDQREAAQRKWAAEVAKAGSSSAAAKAALRRAVARRKAQKAKPK
jgi:hypothetical protein